MINAYLRIAEIPGACQKSGRENCIELISMKAGVRCTAGRHDGTIDVVGESIPIEFTIEKHIDQTSAKMLKSCSEGARFKEVIVELWRAEGTGTKWMEYTMSPARLTSVAHLADKDTND